MFSGPEKQGEESFSCHKTAVTVKCNDFVAGYQRCHKTSLAGHRYAIFTLSFICILHHH